MSSKYNIDSSLTRVIFENAYHVLGNDRLAKDSYT